MRKCGIEIESLSAHRAVDKLVQAGIEVLGAEKIRKNAVIVWVNAKDEKKVFAILQGSCYNMLEATASAKQGEALAEAPTAYFNTSQTCYNIVKVHYRGLERLRREALKSVGLIAGAAVFLFLVCFMQTRILRIEIVGSGAYYEREVHEILSRNSTKLFSAKPKEGAVTSEILALPRVSFCSLALSGGVLTVTVEVSDENALIENSPLLAPADGILEELVVVRGTAFAAVGSEVHAGDILVDCHAPVGESGSRSVIVIARAKVSFAVQKEYALSEDAAIAQAYIDYGEITDLKATQTEGGCLIEGRAHAETALNLD